MGILGTFRDAVVLVNRTLGAGKYEQNLNVRFDGEDIMVKPGENPGFPKVAVPYAKKQNPLMGSKHPINPTLYISLVGVKDSKDDVTPISEATLARAAGCLEVVDRDGSFHDEPMRKVKLLKKTGHSAYEAIDALPSDFAINRNID